MTEVSRNEIVRHLDEMLQVATIEDDSNNGLQVQGAERVSRIALATDAALEVYRQAAAARCQFLIAHHGLIWRGIRSVTGREYEHLRFLIENDMNLYAAHLPLDLHPEVGNNIELTRLIDLQDVAPFGGYRGAALGFVGQLPAPMTPQHLAEAFQKQIGGDPLILPFGDKQVRQVAIVSGGASSMLPEAIERGVDCFVTGEGKQADHHLALEAGINVIYLSHYHSETLGVKALGQALEQRFEVETIFIDVPTLF